MSSLIEQARSVVDRYRDIDCTVRENSIDVRPASHSGFSFSIIDQEREVVLFFGNWHYPFSDPQEAISLFGKCLSGDAQIREFSKLGIPYKGILEVENNGEGNVPQRYEMASIIGLFIFPFPRRERVFCNNFQKDA